MKNLFTRLFTDTRFFKDESGQDLIEYVLVAALIALGATVGMTSIATHINTAFTNIGTKLQNYTT